MTSVTFGSLCSQARNASASGARHLKQNDLQDGALKQDPFAEVVPHAGSARREKRSQTGLVNHAEVRPGRRPAWGPPTELSAVLVGVLLWRASGLLHECPQLAILRFVAWSTNVLERIAWQAEGIIGVVELLAGRALPH